MKTSVTWVVLADGTQAKVFTNTGRDTGLTAVADLMFEEEALKAGEIMADRPGRSFSSVGEGRSGMEYTSDPVRVREERFLRQLAEALERKHQERAFTRLVVAAAPEALGILRGTMSSQLRSTVVAELPKNLTRVPTQELERHLGDVLTM